MPHNSECLISVSFLFRSLEQTVPDLMFYHDRGTEQHSDEAKMHHFLETNLFRAKPRVSERTNLRIFMRRNFQLNKRVLRFAYHFVIDSVFI
jgi:hypothetical protein